MTYLINQRYHATDDLINNQLNSINNSNQLSTHPNKPHLTKTLISPQYTRHPAPVLNETNTPFRIPCRPKQMVTGKTALSRARRLTNTLALVRRTPPSRYGTEAAHDTGAWRESRRPQNGTRGNARDG